MITNPILYVFALFVARLYFVMAKKYSKNLFLYSFFGLLSFLLSYFVFTIVFDFLFLKAFQKIILNTIIMSCFTIPLAIIVSGGFYKFFENRFQKSHKNLALNEIGKN